MEIDEVLEARMVSSPQKRSACAKRFFLRSESSGPLR